MFARPFPEFSAKLNAKVTWAAGGWLMGPLELRDLEEESGAVHKSNFAALLTAES